MEHDNEEVHGYIRRGAARDRAIAGLFLILAGSLLFAYKLGAPLPGWLFTFPSLLIAIGLIAGLKHRFRHPAWLIPFGIGIFLSIDHWIPGVNIREYTAPVVIIFIGLFFLLRPKNPQRHNKFREFNRKRQEWKEKMQEDYVKRYSEINPGDFIDSVCAFGSVKKKIVSKNFTGGDVTCIMGGAELDLSQADIQGRVVLDVTQLFGGTKLIIPPHWDLKTEMAAIFGGIEDKRPLQGTVADMNKVLVLRGTSIFGGIDIKSY